MNKQLTEYSLEDTEIHIHLYYSPAGDRNPYRNLIGPRGSSYFLSFRNEFEAFKFLTSRSIDTNNYSLILLVNKINKKDIIYTWTPEEFISGK